MRFIERRGRPVTVAGASSRAVLAQAEDMGSSPKFDWDLAKQETPERLDALRKRGENGLSPYRYGKILRRFSRAKSLTGRKSPWYRCWAWETNHE